MNGLKRSPSGLRQQEEEEEAESNMEKGESAVERLDSVPTRAQSTHQHCPVCYDELGDEEASSIIRIEACGHVFCQACISSFCNLSIQQRRRSLSRTIDCPEQGCSTVLPSDLVLTMCSTANAQRYRRLLEIQANPKLVACPRCDELAPASGGQGSSAVDTVMRPSRLCPSCGHDLVRHHQSPSTRSTARGQSHTTLSDRVNRKLTIKPCSHCGIPVQLAGGCEHIVCAHCDHDFCFRCGTHEHLTGDGSIRTCTLCKQRYLDHRRIKQHRRRACMWLPVKLPLVVLYIVLALLVFVTSCGCGCLFGCGTLVDEQGRVRPKFGAQMTLLTIVAPFLELLQDFGVQGPWLESLTATTDGQQHDRVEAKRQQVGIDSRGEDSV